MISSKLCKYDCFIALRGMDGCHLPVSDVRWKTHYFHASEIVVEYIDGKEPHSAEELAEEGCEGEEELCNTAGVNIGVGKQGYMKESVKRWEYHRYISGKLEIFRIWIRSTIQRSGRQLKRRYPLVNIQKVTHNKKTYIDLLLLADEQESMIDKYLERGDMFVLIDNEVKAECVITKEADGIYELKNIAVLPEWQRQGYGKRMIDFLFSQYSDCSTVLVGTGDVPSTLNFYHKCGFTESHRIKNFFTDNYDHPMFEDGRQLVDMVYLKRKR